MEKNELMVIDNSDNSNNSDILKTNSEEISKKSVQKKIPKLKKKDVEIVKCNKCGRVLIHTKFRDTYICTECNLAYNFN